MTRLIYADEAIKRITAEYNKREAYKTGGLKLAWIEQAISGTPTVEPTLYGYKVEHLALIARVMQKDGVTPEEAVQIFKSVQTIALKVINEIDDAVKRAFEQAMETGNGEDGQRRKEE